MIFHLSIDADDPRHVASVIAELWRGRSAPFPPVAEGSWVALALDERNSTIEVYPRGTELHPAQVDADAVAARGEPHGFCATHAAIATPLSLEEVMAIAERENWPARYRKRGGLFGVIELWLEGRVMVEVLTAEMQAEYLAMKGPPLPLQGEPRAS
jgi:hypothetical protein